MTHGSIQQYRPDIDGLRAIAILSVVAFHAYPALVPGGFVGVDIFFVISGFLITGIITRQSLAGSFSFRDFYARRIKRIFPSLVVVLAASLAMAWFLLMPKEFMRFGKHLAGGVFFISNYLLRAESGYFDADSHEKPLMHLWSLSIEEQFYILWPLLLTLAYKYRARRYVWPLILGILAMSFSANAVEVRIRAAGAFYSPLSRFWELLAGASLAVLSTRHSLPSLANSLARRALRRPHDPAPTLDAGRMASLFSILGLALFLVAFFAMPKDALFPGFWALLPTCGAFLLIAAGPQAWANRAILATRPMVFIGLISYPLYLWHWPLLSFLHIQNPMLPEWAWQRSAAAGASMVLAFLTYKLVEKPIRFGTGGYRVAGLCAAMALLACAHPVITQGKGMRQRFPEAALRLAEFNSNAVADYREGTFFLNPNQDWKTFPKEPEQPAKPRRLLLWGDSFAAHLYPGLSRSVGPDVQVVQRTASGCPPIMDRDQPDRRFCRGINDHIRSLISAGHFDEVVLAARWDRYEDGEVTKLERTIEALRRDVGRIALIGPLPRYGMAPSRLILSQMLRRGDGADMASTPRRFPLELAERSPEQDRMLGEIAARTGVLYISPVALLCDDGGCLNRQEDTPEAIFSWDSAGHLSVIGSEYLARHILERMAQGTPAPDSGPASPAQ